MPGRRAIAAGGVALIALVVVAGFGIARSSDEPDDDAVTAIDDTEGEDVRAECLVADADGALILYPGSFTAGQRTQLVSVTLDDPENFETVEGFVSDYRGPEDLQGVVLDYPPRSTSFVEGLTDWDSRRPIADLVVRPDDGPQAVLVVVRLTDPTKPGHVRGVTIEARTPARERTLAFEQLLLVLPDGQACTEDAVAETTEWTG